jgi:hypothetical protein
VPTSPGRALLLTACLLLAAPGQLRAQTSLSVLVLDDSTGFPIPRAGITVDSLLVVHTDSAGRMRYYGLPAGERTVKISRLGYRPQRLAVRLAPGGEMALEVALRPEPISLPEVRFILKMMESRLRAVRFYERRRLGGGLAWGWREIQAVAGGGDVETLLSRLPGFRIRRAPGDSAWVVVSQRGPGLPEACTAQVLVDGQPADGHRLSGLEVEHLAGVEAYAGPATTPAELASVARGSRCGVVALWTRVGPS